MKKQFLLFTLALTVLTFFGCKPPKEFIKDVKVSVNPVENHAGKVEVTMDGTFPVKYFQKNMILTVTPVLKSKINGQEFAGQPVTYQGEKVKDNNQKISYKLGGKYSQKATFTYDPAMESSDLILKVTVKIKKKEYTLDPVKVADGVNITPLLVSFQPGTGDIVSQIVADKFQRIIQDKQEAEIRFLIQQSNIRKSELKSESVIGLTKRIQEATKDQNLVMQGLEISSYASPDGGVELNEKIAGSREKETMNYINKEMKKLKASVGVTGKFTAEDWDGFQALVENSNIQDKQLILRVLSMYTDPEQREKEIKNLTAAFKVLADDILPQLRRSKMTLMVDIVGKSDEEIAALAKNDVSKLSVEELLYAATLTTDATEKAAIYTKATEVYPSEFRGYNNLGMVYFELGKVDQAGRCFAKALELAPKSPEVNYNNAIVALAKGDFEKAEQFLGNAGGVGAELNYVNGALAIKKADYSKAVSLFGDAKMNNAALAKILVKDYNGARNILTTVASANATTYYLMAIVGARTNDRDLAAENLKKAIAADANFKAKAAKDVEFLTLMNDATFAAIVK